MEQRQLASSRESSHGGESAQEMAAPQLRSESQTQNLVQKFAVDGLAALTAATAVSPVMVVIDRAVTEAAAGQRSFLGSAKACLADAAKHPQRWFASKPFAAMMMLYLGTYTTANAIDTIGAHSEGLPASTTTSTSTKLAAVTTANVGLALYKDATFARAFGTTGLTRSLPAVSYAPFIIRDGITLFATFNLPAIVAPMLPEKLEGLVSRMSVAQLAMPMTSQYFCTPLHLVGLDLYYRLGRLGFRERMKAIRQTWLTASNARALRVLPAYGLGGVLNVDARKWLIERID
ncbi:hypothetical protein DOTSEDRAFT_54701 [Dothistroma septosporum NZE10]|uniref:Sequence orphan n=1 Tax=Dothistroma septosporum (strain NZE10 / CBS 128990) TaxID=675120 RepID=N1PLW3_DOTSN|nr:hypothetical protein DOTSEDRAFT_54701 [Dothistroma septosporum NZE10]